MDFGIFTSSEALRKTNSKQLPLYQFPIHLVHLHRQVEEWGGCMTSVLLQKHGDRLKPVVYFSSKLDAIAAGLPLLPHLYYPWKNLQRPVRAR